MKEKIINILRKRIQDAFSNGCYNHNRNSLNYAIKVINELVPPEYFDELDGPKCPVPPHEHWFQDGVCVDCGAIYALLSNEERGIVKNELPKFPPPRKEITSRKELAKELKRIEDELNKD
jgi:hypothetical protein